MTNKITGMADEIASLRRWKSEAMAVLSEWERVYEALGRPGQLGESKAKASEAEVLRLLARRRRQSRHHHRPVTEGPPAMTDPAEMGPVAQEELRRAAYYVTEALALGHQCDPGLGERIARLADVLGRTRGWTP